MFCGLGLGVEVEGGGEVDGLCHHLPRGLGDYVGADDLPQFFRPGCLEQRSSALVSVGLEGSVGVELEGRRIRNVEFTSDFV